MKQRRQSEADPASTVALARQFASGLSDGDRSLIFGWQSDLLDIRNSDLSVVQKGRAALLATARVELARPLLNQVARHARELGMSSKRVLWDQSGWIARLGLAGLLVGAFGYRGQRAGIAARGKAIGVPLWLVVGAGGAFLGALLDELRPHAPSTTYTVIEARKVSGPDVES